jgi:hypothetical protein
MRQIACYVLLVSVAFVARAQTNELARPARPIEMLVRIGECESRLGKVEVVVSGIVEQGKSTIRIQCRLNQQETACELDSQNAMAVAQLLQKVSSGLMNGKPSAGKHRNVEVSSFQLENKKFVEILFHRGESTEGESACRLWLDSYNALSLSHLIVAGKAATDWLQPRLVPLE